MPCSVLRARCKTSSYGVTPKGLEGCRGGIRYRSELARRYLTPHRVCYASIKLHQLPEGKAEALFESVRKLCETMALLRQHDLSPELRESVLVTMQGVAEEYGTCLVEHLSAAIPPVGFKRPEAIQQLKELVWGTCSDGLYTCLILDERSTLLDKVRKYLTIAEQIELFEAAPEGWRWSAEEVYDISLVYLAEGFMRRKPQDVLKAEQLLVWCTQLYMAGAPGSNKVAAKAVYTERAVCAVLLNQFDKAQKLMKLAGGRPLSQLDGWGMHAATSMYLMSEKWMAQELFPRFPECADVDPSMELWLKETTPFLFLQAREAAAEPLSVRSRIGAALHGVVVGAALMGVVAAALWRSRDVENPLPQAFASAATLVQINPEQFSAQLGFSASFAMNPNPTQITTELDSESGSSTTLTPSPMMAGTMTPHVSPSQPQDSRLPSQDTPVHSPSTPISGPADASSGHTESNTQLDVKAAESVVQKWQAAKALAWNHPNPEQWLQQCCGREVLQQALTTMEQDHKAAVYRTILPQAVKVLTVQPEGVSTPGQHPTSWAVVAHIKETQCEGSETSGGPMVRHQHDYRMEYKVVRHGSKWRIVEAQALGQQQQPKGLFGIGAEQDKDLPHL